MPLELLATDADVVTELGRDLTDAEAGRVDALLAKASRLVRAYTRQTFTHVAGDVAVLRITAGQLRLPQRPVTAVTTVKLVGFDGTSRYPIPFSWDGLDMVTLFGGCEVLNLPEALVDVPATTAEVTYSHGYEPAPADVTELVAGMTARVFQAPGSAGVSYQSAGPFSYRTADGYDAGTVTLAQADKDYLDAAGYRRQLKIVGLMP